MGKGWDRAKQDINDKAKPYRDPKSSLFGLMSKADQKNKSIANWYKKLESLPDPEDPGVAMDKCMGVMEKVQEVTTNQHEAGQQLSAACNSYAEAVAAFGTTVEVTSCTFSMTPMHLS